MAAALLMFSIVLAVVIVVKTRWLTGRRLRLPPGPKPDPFIGNLRQMPFDNQEETFILWGKTYGAIYPSCTCSNVRAANLLTGDVIYAKIFHRHLIVLNSYKAARDIMQKQGINYACRPRAVLIGELCGVLTLFATPC